MGKWVTWSSIVFQKSKIFILRWALLLIGQSTLHPKKKGFPNFDHCQIKSFQILNNPPRYNFIHLFKKIPTYLYTDKIKESLLETYKKE